MMNNNKITQEMVDNEIKNAKVKTSTIFDKCTVVAVELQNGFIIVESSACVDPKNYSETEGFEICMERIKNKIWELLGFNLQEKVYRRVSLQNNDKIVKKPVDCIATKKNDNICKDYSKNNHICKDCQCKENKITNIKKDSKKEEFKKYFESKKYNDFKKIMKKNEREKLFNKKASDWRKTATENNKKIMEREENYSKLVTEAMEYFNNSNDSKPFVNYAKIILDKYYDLAGLPESMSLIYNLNHIVKNVFGKDFEIIMDEIPFVITKNIEGNTEEYIGFYFKEMVNNYFCFVSDDDKITIKVSVESIINGSVKIKELE